MEIKLCQTCQLKKEISLFHKKKDGKLGVKPECKECCAKRNRAYYLLHRVHIQNQSKEYHRQNRDEINQQRKEYHKVYYLQNQERLRERAKQQRDRRRVYERNYRRNQRKDPRHRLDDNISRSIQLDLRCRGSGKNGKSWESLVGYTLGVLRQRLESQFHKDPKITWENMGSYWHVDHIRPKASFSYATSSDIEFQECWALENLQPLEACANLRKGSKW